MSMIPAAASCRCSASRSRSSSAVRGGRRSRSVAQVSKHGTTSSILPLVPNNNTDLDDDDDDEERVSLAVTAPLKRVILMRPDALVETRREAASAAAIRCRCLSLTNPHTLVMNRSIRGTASTTVLSFCSAGCTSDMSDRSSSRQIIFRDSLATSCGSESSKYRPIS